MNIEISGVGFRNMGAELMLTAACQQLRKWPVEDVAIGFLIGSRGQRERVGCSGVVRLDASRLRWARPLVSMVVALVPASLLDGARLRKPMSMDALLDASGYALGDQFGPAPAHRMSAIFRSYASAGRPVVLLPQAFGPFDVPMVADAAREALEFADLIFARDPESLDHLRRLGLAGPRISMAPDFTNLLEPQIQALPPRTVVMIPNARMTETDGTVSESDYVEFLVRCADAALARDCRVMVLTHDTADRAIAARLGADLGERVSVLTMPDAIHTKALIGGAALVISSRYHGLVNALSQCVPAIGTSWSHKYPLIFRDYACSDGLWEVNDPTTADRLDGWLDESFLADRRQALQVPAAALKQSSRAMWEVVHTAVTGQRPDGPGS